MCSYLLWYSADGFFMQKYNYKPDWGETFTGKHDPSLVIVNIDTFDVKVLDRLKDDMSPGQVSGTIALAA